MALEKMDLTGLKCPEPSMRVAARLMLMKPGDIIEATADCDTFEADMRNVCTRWKKVLLSVKTQGRAKTIQIQI